MLTIIGSSITRRHSRFDNHITHSFTGSWSWKPVSWEWWKWKQILHLERESYPHLWHSGSECYHYTTGSLISPPVYAVLAWLCNTQPRYSGKTLTHNAHTVPVYYTHHHYFTITMFLFPPIYHLSHFSEIDLKQTKHHSSIQRVRLTLSTTLITVLS